MTDKRGSAGNGATNPVLSVKNLVTSFRFGGEWRRVVKGVSFDVMPNETIALVGESGSGKSVTAMSIMRLIGKALGRVEGQVMLSGTDLLALPEPAMRKIRGKDIAMVFQEPMTSLNPVLKVGWQIRQILMRHRGMSRAEADAEALRLLERVRIPAARSRLDEYPHRLSGGMRQRIMIAMALACRPKLLIADEPTTALDVTIQAQILELIKILQDEEGMSVLFITHDMGVVAEIADRMVIMYRGEAVESGGTAAIFAGAQHPYSRSLLASVTMLGATTAQPQSPLVSSAAPASGMTDACAAPATTRAAAGGAVLQIRNLTTRFAIRSGLLKRTAGVVHAVENISFDLGAGETLALVGESGCGKSTTGRSIMRLNEPTSGSIVVNGIDILKLERRELQQRRRMMQMIFQNPLASLNPRIRIGSAIAEPLVVNGLATRRQADEKVADLLQRVGLQSDMARRFPHEFSGGQRQRICIARSLALDPSLIVADEAVSALDVSIKAQVVDLMLDLQGALKISYLFISHDMAVVERISHRVAVMYLGEIVEIGPRAAIFGNPQHPYTKRLLHAVPLPDPTRRRERRGLSNEEISSPIRSPDYLPPAREYREVAPGHLVQL